MGAVIGAIGLGIAAIGAVGQFTASRKAEKAQKRAAEQQRLALEARQKQEEIAFKRRQREILRETLRQRARVIATASSQGINLQASGVQGALGQATSQGAFSQGVVNQDFSFAQRIGAFNTAANSFNAKAADFKSTANTFGGISSLGGSLFSAREDIANVIG